MDDERPVVWHASAYNAGDELLSETGGSAELTSGIRKVLVSTPAAFCFGAMLINLTVSRRHYRRVEPVAPAEAVMMIRVERVLNRTTDAREGVARLNIAMENGIALVTVTADQRTLGVRLDCEPQDGAWDIVLRALPRVIFSSEFQR
jgi:hypothetical protein